MSTKIGHFEILSELAKSPTGTIYKANDAQGQTVVLKAIELSAFGESAAALEQALLQETEATKALTSSNITIIFGAGEIEGKFCAAMEYVQGNSIATMLARKEGFSIWDLLDIGRQVCAGLDYAHGNQAYHYSLEPAKVMCGWDGTVKILSYGVSSAGKFAHQISGGIPSFLPYLSPEQMRGEEIDARSNLFSLGAMFYEMVTDRKAFDGEDAASVRRSILESTPLPPLHVNPKLHPLLSDLIMKALEKDPAKRYQRGRELLDNLENCKESRPQVSAKPGTAPKGIVVPDQGKAAVQQKFAGAPGPKAVAPQPPVAQARPAQPKAAAPKPPERKIAAPSPEKHVAAAAAGLSGHGGTSTGSQSESPYMSAAPPPEVETFAPDAPKIAVDPMMAEGEPSGGRGSSFSEISELPPLKEVYIAPPPPPPPPVHSTPPPATMFQGKVEEKERPKIQPGEVAQRAIKEIKGVPPRLMLYSIGGAVALILVIVAAMWFRYSTSGDDDGGASRASAPAQESAQPAPSQPAPQNDAAPAPARVAPTPVAEPAQTEEQPEAQPVARANSRGRSSRRIAAPVPVVVPGQLALDSTPQGAQVQIDGKGDASWVTPLAVTNLQPGSHSITVTKPGYSSDTRAVTVASGSKSTLVIHLAQMMATLAVTSDPPGASIYVDGRDMGKTTPARVSLEKGTHVILVRKMGYIDETASAQFALGQTVSMTPTLRPLGNVDSIRTTGKMKKLFGGKGGQPGQGTVSIHTQPKGAQVAVNQRMLDKGSPVEIMLDPGNYVIDLTLSGYAPIHKVVTVDKGGKVVVDENMTPQ